MSYLKFGAEVQHCNHDDKYNKIYLLYIVCIIYKNILFKVFQTICEYRYMCVLGEAIKCSGKE